MLKFLKKYRLFHAANFGDVNDVRVLASKGVDLNMPVHANGARAMHLATRQGHLTVVKALISAGADVNARGPFGYTPLHCAAAQGDGAAASLLLASGAQADTRDANGMTPLHVAAQTNNVAVIQALLESACQINATMPETGWTALDWAEMKQNHDAASLLREGGGTGSQ